MDSKIITSVLSSDQTWVMKIGETRLMPSKKKK